MKLLVYLYQNYISYELRLFLDLFRDHPSKTEGVLLKKEFPLKLRKKKLFITLLDKSQRTKLLSKDNYVLHQVLHNQRRIQDMIPKLQNNWEGLYKVMKKINDVVYYILEIE